MWSAPLVYQTKPIWVYVVVLVKFVHVSANYIVNSSNWLKILYQVPENWQKNPKTKQTNADFCPLQYEKCDALRAFTVFMQTYESYLFVLCINLKNVIVFLLVQTYLMFSSLLIKYW